MSGSKDLLKVQQLIALALGSDGEEARTAAALACRLIRDKGLVLMAPDDQRLLPPAPVAWSPPPAPAQPSSSSPRPSATPDPSTSSIPPVDQAAEDVWIQARRIRIKYLSVCRFCWKNVSVGEYAFWASKEGVICENCHDTMLGG
jgi:hypothetical protein